MSYQVVTVEGRLIVSSTSLSSALQVAANARGFKDTAICIHSVDEEADGNTSWNRPGFDLGIMVVMVKGQVFTMDPVVADLIRDLAERNDERISRS